VSPHEEKFVEVNGARLEYLDWGGRGQTLILLPGLGSSAHIFDRLALHFTSRFHVIALTRRGQPPSSIPAVGYDLATLSDDIWKAMQALGVSRAHLAGAGVAGAEMTRLAALYPHRVLSLVYLDAYDGAEANEVLQGDPATPLPPPRASIPGRIEGWWTSHAEDFSVVRCPALALYELQQADPYLPADAPATLRERADTYWQTRVAAFVRHSAERFEREVPHGRAIVFDRGSGVVFTDHEAEVADAMERFYSALPPQ
jgi:pimeloyl-ACP methyl ester carboxylesterase